jgi:hypothetical protein
MEARSGNEARASRTWLALGEVALLWMGALVGPMLFATAVVGAIWGLAAGLIAGALCLLAVVTVAARVRRAPQSRMGAAAPTEKVAAGGTSRLLVVAGAAAAGPGGLPAGVRALIASADEVLVVAPSLPGRLDWITSATDRAQTQADERLRSVLGHVDGLGTVAVGTVGADDPLLAFEDAVRRFAPDHILIGLRPADRARWQEKGLLDEIQQRFAIPTTVLQIP